MQRGPFAYSYAGGQAPGATAEPHRNPADRSLPTRGLAAPPPAEAMRAYGAAPFYRAGTVTGGSPGTWNKQPVNGWFGFFSWGDGTGGKKPQVLPRAVDPGFPPRPAGTRYKLPRLLTQPARAAEGSEPSRPAAGATASLPPGATRVRTAPDSRSGTPLRGRAAVAGPSPSPGRRCGESLPAGAGSRRATQHPLPSAALIPRCYSYGEPRQPPLARGAIFPREPRAAPAAKGASSRERAEGVRSSEVGSGPVSPPPFLIASAQGSPLPGRGASEGRRHNPVSRPRRGETSLVCLTNPLVGRQPVELSPDPSRSQGVARSDSRCAGGLTESR